jgi:hypothetical protein
MLLVLVVLQCFEIKIQRTAGALVPWNLLALLSLFYESERCKSLRFDPFCTQAFL